MNETAFTQQIMAMSDRLSHLYQRINTSASQSSNLLSSTLPELGIAFERLQRAAELLYQQNQQLVLANQTVQNERRHYQELLEFIPDACLLTDTDGRIHEANRAAAKLLNLQQPLLIGRSLINFVAHETRQQFQTDLQQLQQRPWKQEWQVRLLPEQGLAFDVSVVVEVNRQEVNQPLTLRWLLRQQSHNLITTNEQSDTYTNLSYPLQHYHKGETIPLNPQTIWQVCSGLVKLTTFSDRGQKVLLGLAGASAPFGPSLTALPLYEAIALADTQLWSIPMSEFVSSVELKQRLLPQISQRLRQTELLLAVYGQARVLDRLNTLLEVLKQEIGQPVKDGIRLSVRLTHEDLAIATCTTRVTITQLLKQLQQQKKLKIDSQHHLILKA
ncbi:PAS domain S-box protein [Nostoc sp. T09]|uniref:PAS domain-containing protein n=1 Tax=Nostoc sp. T09 TaxID=1932621 RepID=UPI000A36F916|nr:PAS domain-containing protein [Nostoc sp. T09]OUL27446.1 PAS domain S-box protein [Nostoc sp. T09]